MKRKQIIVLGLVLVIIAVGILQYNSGDTGEYPDVADAGYADAADGDVNPEDIPGAAVYVAGEENGGSSAADSSEDGLSIESGYFAQAKLDRDRVRSRQKEELKSLVENGDPTSPVTLQAQEELVGVINRSDVENTIETLIKQRGFSDALVYMSSMGYVDVVVNASSLSEKQVAQISDIVVRHADVTMDCISVKNVD
jgi:stage III sporulation protein AH